MQSALRLESGKGDETLNQVRYVCYAAMTAADGQAILRDGFRYIEGKPTVSTNLILTVRNTPASTGHQAQGGAMASDGPQALVLLMVPPPVQVGYGIFTDAVVDRALKQVTGAPLRYAEARKQLAFYPAANWQVRRRDVERAVAAQDMSLLHTQTLPPVANLGILTVSGGIATILQELGAAAYDVSPFDIQQAAQYVQSEVQLSQQLNPQELAQAIQALIIGTVESVIISRLRMLRWEGLAGQGYHFHEGQSDVTAAIVPRQRDRQLEILEKYRLVAESSLFLQGKLGWLKPYVHRAIEIMKVEIVDLA